MPGTSERGQVWAADGRFCVQAKPPGEGASPNVGFRGACSNQCRNDIDHNGPGNEGAERGRFQSPISGAEKTFIGWLASLC